jgi:hypothetical protein
MVPEDLLFWVSKMVDAPTDDPNVLCRRHADAMVVPRGWTLDDRREDTLRLFRPKPPPVVAPSAPPAPQPRRRPRVDRARRPQQLQIDGTGEIPRPVNGGGLAVDVAPTVVVAPTRPAAVAAAIPTVPVEPVQPPAPAWQPDFDADDDLNGLLEVSSPLLARAFRGTDRRRS